MGCVGTNNIIMLDRKELMFKDNPIPQKYLCSLDTSPITNIRAEKKGERNAKK